MWSQTLPELIIWIIITCHFTCILIKTLISSPLSNFLLVIKIKIIRAISLIIVWKCWWFLPSLLLVWLPSCLFPLSEWIFFYKKLNKIKILLVVMELTWASIIPDSLKGWDSWLSWKPWLLLALYTWFVFSVSYFFNRFGLSAMILLPALTKLLLFPIEDFTGFWEAVPLEISETVPFVPPIFKLKPPSAVASPLSVLGLTWPRDMSLFSWPAIYGASLFFPENVDLASISFYKV